MDIENQPSAIPNSAAETVFGRGRIRAIISEHLKLFRNLGAGFFFAIAIGFVIFAWSVAGDMQIVMPALFVGWLFLNAGFWLAPEVRRGMKVVWAIISAIVFFVLGMGVQAHFHSGASARSDSTPTYTSSVAADCDFRNLNIPIWLKVASKECGQREERWPRENSRIKKYYASLKNGLNYRQDSDDLSSDWASPFVEWTLNQVGIDGPKKIDPFAWLNWGKKIDAPQIGAIIILSINGIPHVGFYVGEVGDRVKVLGGNEDEQVEIARYPRTEVKGYRVPIELSDKATWVTTAERQGMQKKGRILVSYNPEELMSLFYGYGYSGVSAYVGQWIKISHQMELVKNFPSTRGHNAKLIVKVKSVWDLEAEFETESDRDKLLTYHSGQYVDAWCKIAFDGQPAKFDVKFIGRSCELAK